MLPFWALLRSRRSLTKERRNLPDWSMSERYFCVVGEFGSLRARVALPITTLSGVRISWDMREKKTLLASEASFSVAAASFSRSAASLNLRLARFIQAKLKPIISKRRALMVEMIQALEA